MSNKLALLNTIKDHFNLTSDMDDEATIIENVTRGAELRGANLWVLIFAIVIASIGLNVNSTAVIIGAMLISPLMGPLIAIGLGLSINDFDLIKLAIKNLGFALAASLVASTLYFLITPLDQAQTEILARTSPTIFDVFIAFAGGLAGMIAASRKVKGNVLPGVAIATALMPPLCTAGYGIATGNWQYFFGAFYLYFINCVFIFLGTFLIVRMMHFQKKTFVDKKLEFKIRTYMYVMIAVTVLPSGYLAYNMINKTLSERSLNDFIAREVSGKGIAVIEKKIIDKDKFVEIEISTVGTNITTELNHDLNERLKLYKIKDVVITLKELGARNNDIVAIKSAIIEELYKNNEELIKDKDQKIALLEEQLMAVKQQSDIPQDAIKSELTVMLPMLKELILTKFRHPTENKSILLAYLGVTGTVSPKELPQIKEWLRVRTSSDDVKIMVEKMKSEVAEAKRKKSKK